MKGVLSVGLLLLLVSCQPAVLRPLGWTGIPEYNTLPTPQLFNTEPAGLIAGDLVPFDGFLIATQDWRRITQEYTRLQEALRLSQQGRGGDRATCDEFVTTLQGEIGRLKADRPRICGLCAAGASGISIGLTGAVAARACD